MASLGHVAIGMAAGRAYGRRGRAAIVAMVAFSAVSLLPDLDVVAFALDIPYAHAFGHRGASHSLAAALALGLLALAPPSERRLRTALFVTLVAASHSLLDALTDGGLGVALLWPITSARYFAPWQPIPVAPIGARMLSARGLYVIAVEAVLFAPFFVYALWPRRAKSPGRNKSCIRPPRHPRSRRRSSLRYFQYLRSSLLASGAPRRPRCWRLISTGLLTQRELLGGAHAAVHGLRAGADVRQQRLVLLIRQPGPAKRRGQVGHGEGAEAYPEPAQRRHDAARQEALGDDGADRLAAADDLRQALSLGGVRGAAVGHDEPAGPFECAAGQLEQGQDVADVLLPLGVRGAALRVERADDVPVPVLAAERDHLRKRRHRRAVSYTGRRGMARRLPTVRPACENGGVKHTAESVTEGIDLRGKTALVTGGTSGLGRECARVLALRGARVILACRSEAKGAETIARITPGPQGRLEARPCELTSMRSVRALADSLDAVDLVFLNGGVFGLPFELTEEGFERTYAANYLGHFLLVHRLLARGALPPGARVLATLSEGVLNPFARVRLEALREPARRRFSQAMASPATKILLARMAVELARRAAQAGARVAMNGVSPPATLTDNVNQGGPVLRALGRAIGPAIFKPVEEGATVLVWAATSAELEGRSGEAFSSKLARTALPRKCTDPGLASASWDASERALGLPPWP